MFDMTEDDIQQIQVHCTIGRDSLQSDGENIVCKQCERKLVNLCDGGDSKQDFNSHCGIYAGVTVAALAASLALSSCATSKSGPPFILGSVSPPIESQTESVDPKEYPEGAWIDDSFLKVKSPYSEQIVVVENLPDGALVNEPFEAIEREKYFRVPECDV